MLAASMLTIMAAAIIAPSLTAMRSHFSGNPSADLLVRLALTSTALAIALTAPVSGMVADRIGRRPLLVTSLILYAVSGAAGLIVNDLSLLILTRVVLGVAVGGIMTAVSATIAEWFQGSRRASYLGLQQAFASWGGVVFLPVAGLLAAASWRAPFALYAVAVPTALLVILAFRGEPAGRRAPRANGETTFSARTVPRLVGAYTLAFVATLAFYMAPTQLPFLLADFGSGAVVVGLVIAASTFTSALAALAFPAVHRRLPPDAITAVSIALLGAGWILVGTSGTIASATAGLLVGGLGVGLVVPNLNLRLSELAQPHQRGRVLSGLVSGIFLGQFFSPLVVQPVVEARGIAIAFIWAGALMAAGAGLAAISGWLRGARRGPSAVQPALATERRSQQVT